MDLETGPSLSNMPGMRISHCLKSRTPIAALMDKRGGGSSNSSVVLVSSLRKSQLSMLWPLMRTRFRRGNTNVQTIRQETSKRGGNACRYGEPRVWEASISACRIGGWLDN